MINILLKLTVLMNIEYILKFNVILGQFVLVKQMNMINTVKVRILPETLSNTKRINLEHFIKQSQPHCYTEAVPL